MAGKTKSLYVLEMGNDNVDPKYFSLNWTANPVDTSSTHLKHTLWNSVALSPIDHASFLKDSISSLHDSILSWLYSIRGAFSNSSKNLSYFSQSSNVHKCISPAQSFSSNLQIYKFNYFLDSSTWTFPRHIKFILDTSNLLSAKLNSSLSARNTPPHLHISVNAINIHPLIKIRRLGIIHIFFLSLPPMSNLAANSVTSMPKIYLKPISPGPLL